MTNAGWNAFSTIWSIAISFVIAPLLIRNLGTAQYGILLLVWSVNGILGLAGFGFGEATLRYVAHYHANEDISAVNRVFGSTLSFYAVTCVIILAVLFPAAPMVVAWLKIPVEEHYAVGWLVRLSALVFSLGMITSAYAAIPMALQRYDVSSKINISQSVARSGGYIVLAVSGFGILHLVLWDLLMGFAMLFLQIGVARKLLPGVRSIPRFSVAGLREIFGYSIFSFLTQIFHTIYRESGKLIVASHVGPTGVAYLGTPDSIAYRIYMVIVSGIETLMPRFSAGKNPETAKSLLVVSTWAAVCCGVVLYIPMGVLMPDFLRLWINPEFARESGPVGRLLALSFIAPTAFSPIATLFRGMGKPGFVTLVMASAGIVVLVSMLLLVSSHGLLAVGLGYGLSAIAWLGGTFGGWLYLHGRGSMVPLMRVVGLPLVLGGCLGAGQAAFRDWWGELGWLGLFLVGGTSAGISALVLVGVDRALGGTSPSEHVLGRVFRSQRFVGLRLRLGLSQ